MDVSAMTWGHDQLRRNIREAQRGHWQLLLLKRREGWPGRRILEHYRTYVEGMPARMAAGESPVVTIARSHDAWRTWFKQ